MAVGAIGSAALVVAATPAFAGTGQVNVSPSAQNAQTGGSVTLTIEVQNVGQVKAFVPVVVQITIGPDANSPQTLTTDGNGEIAYTINNNGGGGTDGLLAQWTDAAGTTIDGIGTVTWQPPPVPAPTITETFGPSNGAIYPYGGVPAIGWSCSSPVGISSCNGVDENGTPVPNGSQLGAATGVLPGNYSITVTAVANDGQSSTFNLSYLVVGAPTITTSGLANGGTYTFGAVPGLGYSCISPVSHSCSAGVEVTTPGNWSVTVTSTDSFNQTATTTISYTVVKAPQAITFTSSAPSPSLYGGTYTVTANGGDSGNPVTFTAAAMSVCTVSGSTVTFTGVGTCTILANQVGNSDYFPAPQVSQAINVKPAPLKVTASSSTSIYGSPIAAVTPSYSGFVFSDSSSTLTPAATCSSAAVQSSNVGTYTNSCSGASDPDYAISYTNGTQKINPAPLAITASSPTIFYGQAIPAITPSYSGFVLGQTASVLNPQPTCVVPATIASDAGTYTTFCAGAMDTNYAFTYVNGSLLIKPAPTSLSAAPSVISVLPLNPYLFTLNSQLTSNITGKGVPAQPLSFAIKGGGTLCTAVMTDSNGNAACNALCNSPALSALLSGAGLGTALTQIGCQLLLSLPTVLGTILHDGYTVSFGGSHNYLPSSGSGQLIEVLPGLIL